MTPTVDTQAQRVSQARTTLLLDWPFFGSLALNLGVQVDPACDTAWTDGNSFGYNPSFVATLSDAELVGLWAHEAMHCACGHPWRREARDHARFNKAADYAINSIIRDSGLRLPSCALLDSSFDGKSAEWIYNRLPGDPEQDPNGVGTGAGNDPNGDPGGCGEVRDAPPDSNEGTGTADGTSNDPRKLTEADWQQITKQAERISQGQGTLGADIAGRIDKATAKRIDAYSALVRFFTERVNADYSWRQPNPRYIARGLYLPRLDSVACGRLVVAVDTSGSVFDPVTLGEFESVFQAVVDQCQPTAVDVVYCDSSVKGTERFERGDSVKFERPNGGGGTDFRPVFDDIEQSGDYPTALVYLTDLYGSFPDSEPDYPVLWAVTERHGAAPFGEVLVIE